MAAFQYQAVASDGSTKSGTIDAEDRRSALEGLAAKGLFASRLEPVRGGHGQSVATTSAADDASSNGVTKAATSADGAATSPAASQDAPRSTKPTKRTADATPGAKAIAPASEARPPAAIGWDVEQVGRVSRREVTALTREMATLLEASIPIPKALESLGEQEENGSMKKVLENLASQVRRGQSFSGALATYPKLFSKLYTSMIEVGEESGRLAPVMTDLATLREDEDEMRSEVLGAVTYPAFVLVLGIVTTFILLGFVMPSLFKMLEGVRDVLPLPTRILLGTSEFVEANWLWMLLAAGAAIAGIVFYLRTPDGRSHWDRVKLRLPVLGGVFRSSALGRFARTLGTLEVSGVSLLPALEIVKNTVGNRFIAESIEQVTEETRGGDSLAGPIRKLGLFPPTMVQMIAVGEETGRLGQMLLQVAAIQERLVRTKSKTLISLLAPMLILVVGALIGFIVISLLLPIFRMSQGIQ